MNQAERQQQLSWWSRAYLPIVYAMNVYILWHNGFVSLSTIIIIIGLGLCLKLLALGLKIEITETSISQTLTVRGRLKLASYDRILFEDIQQIEVIGTAEKPIVLRITTRQGLRTEFSSTQYSTIESIIAELALHRPFDATPDSLKSYQLEDSGHRSQRVILGSILVFIVVLAMFMCFKYSLHNGVTEFSPWLLGFIPISIITLYPWIRAEQKSTPIRSTIFAGLILGITIAFVIFNAMIFIFD